MKPTSIIFLLVALIIILTGWLVCRQAENKAEAEGIAIFEQTLDSDKNSVYSFQFGKDEVYNKLELIIDKADVYIYGGYTDPYMELVNFDEGSYTMTTANRNISVDTSLDLMSVIKFWESGFSFKGFRNYFRAGTDETVISKRVNVYLPTDGDLNVINIKLDSGSVTVANLDTSVDLTLTLGSGNAVLTSVATKSHLKCDIKTGGLYLSDVSADTLTSTISEGDVTAENFNFKNINIVGTTTNVYIKAVQSTAFYDLYLSARRGNVKIDGEDKGVQYNMDSSNTGDSTVLITVASGNIIMEQ